MYDRKPDFDDRDAELLKARQAARAKLKGPLVGDFVEMPDGRTERFTHDWGKDIQTTKTGWDQSFHFFKDGYMDFSGSLDSPIMKDRLVDTGQTKDGNAWFFHHDWPAGNGGVYVQTPVKVWRYLGKAPEAQQ